MSEEIKICGGCGEYDYECRCPKSEPPVRVQRVVRHQQSFRKLFSKARQSPIYWLEGLDLHFSERIIRYKQRQKRTLNIEKRKNLGSKIRSLKECLQDVRQSMKDYEKMSNDQAQ